MPIAKKTVVSTFSLAMMTAAAVVSLRGLPMMAKEQLTLFVGGRIEQRCRHKWVV
jgi:hypothetical protein